MRREFYGLLIVAFLAAAPAAAEAPSSFAIRNARIVPVSGPAIENGTVVIHDGLISAVGNNVGIPPAALVAPSRGIFPGFSALVNLAGDRAGEMVVKTPVALHTAFPTSAGSRSYPASLMGTLAYVKQTFLDARHYRQAWAAYNGGTRGRKRPPYDRALEHLQPAVAGRMPVLLPAQTEGQIRRCLDLGRELELPVLLYGAHEGYRVARLLAEHKAPVLVSAKWPEKERDADLELEESLRTLRLRDRAASTPAALEKAGVRFAFYSEGIANPKDALRNVKKAIDAGLPPDAALRALTLSAAEILGVADLLGSIETGKVANLVVADGDLFDEKTKIKYVFVDGRKFTVPERQAE